MRLSVLAGMLLAVTFSSQAQAYPTEGYELWGNEAQYESPALTAKESSGDFLYYDVQDKPTYDSLTYVEQLMLGGARPDPQRQVFLDAYYLYVVRAAAAYYIYHGELPASLDLMTLNKLPAFGGTQTEHKRKQMELLRNPLTGKWPRLDAKEHSPGDFYVQVISRPVLDQQSESHPRLAPYWRGEAAMENGKPAKKQVTLYLRMYGVNGPLYANNFTMSLGE